MVIVKRLALFITLLFVYCGASWGQCTIASNVPQYGYINMPNETRQIWVTLAGTCPTSQVTWSVVSGDIKVSSPSNLATALVTLGPTTSSGWSITPATGNPGPYTVTCSPSPVIKATSVDTPANSVNIPFNICPTTDKPMVQPAYQQAWPGTGVSLYSFIYGVAITDEVGSWSVTSQPSSGNMTLSESSTYIVNGVKVATAGSGQTNGTFVINGSGGGGTGAQVRITIAGGVIVDKTIVNAGINYTSAPTFTVAEGGTPGTLTATVGSYRDVVASATVPGKYIVTFTETASPHNTATGAIWVTASGSSILSPNLVQTQPVDCSDPVFTTVYDVGPSQAHTTLSSVFDANLVGGTCVRIRNEDTTGTNPTQYHEYVQLLNNGTQSAPIYIGGIPDSLGNLPIIDGNNATGNAGIANAYDAGGAALILMYSHGYSLGSCYGYSQGGKCGPGYVTITNLHLRNLNPNYYYYPPGSPTITSISRNSGTGKVTAIVSASSDYGQWSGIGINVQNVTGGSTSFNGQFVLTSVSGTTLTWNQAGPTESGTVSGTSQIQEQWMVAGGGCIRMLTGNYNTIISNELDNCFMGIFTQDNGSYEWAGITGNNSIIGNNFNQNGWTDDELDHGMYLQGANYVIVGNYVHNPLAGMTGGGVKWRGMNGWLAYNRIAGPFARCIDRVEVQSAFFMVSMSGYLPNAWLFGDTGGAPFIAANQEQLQHDVMYGNICATTAQSAVHYAFDNGPGETTPAGQLFLFNSTFDMNTQRFVVDNASNNSTNGENFYAAREYLANNSLWGNSSIALNSQSDFIPTLQTNLFQSVSGVGTVTTTTPITVGSAGWNTGCEYACPWPLTLPMETHITGLSSGNFILSPSNPVNTGYFPVSGSPLIGAATPLVGFAANFKVRSNPVNVDGTLVARANANDIGAIMYVAPTLTGVTITTNPASTVVGGVVPMVAACTYSDSVTTTPCTITWTGTNAHTTVNSLTGIVTGVSIGSDTITATVGGLSATATFNVTPTMPRFVGNIGLRGNAPVQ